MKLLPVPTLKCLINEVMNLSDYLLAPENLIKEVLKCRSEALDLGIPTTVDCLTATTCLEATVSGVPTRAKGETLDFVPASKHVVNSVCYLEVIALISTTCRKCHTTFVMYCVADVLLVAYSWK